MMRRDLLSLKQEPRRTEEPASGQMCEREE